MSGVNAKLAEIDAMITSVRLDDAERELRTLVLSITPEDLADWVGPIRTTSQRFLPKRHRALALLIDERLTGAQPVIAPPAPGDEVAQRLRNLTAACASDLTNLLEYHIFQWSTHYRDTLTRYSDLYCELAAESDRPDVVFQALGAQLKTHSREVFAKGYTFTSKGLRDPQQYALTKSMNGLQRFLDLPIEYYAAVLSAHPKPTEARRLRLCCSRSLSGILLGYTTVHLGALSGAQILPRFPRSWAHALAFLTYSDLAAVLGSLEPGDFRDRALASIAPVAVAIDDLSTRMPDYVPTPAWAQLVWDRRRLDVALTAPPRAADPHLIEVSCYLDPAFVEERSLREMLNRNVAVVVAPIGADLKAHLAADDRLRQLVVPSGESANDSRPLLTRLEALIAERRQLRLGNTTLQQNFARDFPLQNPALTRFFYVYRSSVRDLLRTFERGSGVRLWCSVRRSGKTTACADLGSTTGQAIVVSQTCDSTGHIPDGDVFYKAVCAALARGDQLADDFFVELVRVQGFGQGAIEARYIFILDEYESLFGRLKAALRQDSDLRYTVVQPLLNQMVSYARENLLVFLGQQPHAHYILMDQNQLSAYVQQDPFPLFSHDAGTLRGEAPALLAKILSERSEFDSDFADAVYAETAGHPFLTVNVMVEFVDWLIEGRRPAAKLQFDAGDFARFRGARITPSRLSTAPDYAFFRHAIAEALGAQGRASNPWLHAVYVVMRELADASPHDLMVSRSDFARMCKRAQLGDLGLTPDELLATAAQANFLSHDANTVRPTIPLLGRIAAVTVPAMAG